MKLTKREAAVISLYTGYSFCENFGDVHEYADELMPGITTIGLARSHEELQELAKEEFQQIVENIERDD